MAGEGVRSPVDQLRAGHKIPLPASSPWLGEEAHMLFIYTLISDPRCKQLQRIPDPATAIPASPTFYRRTRNRGGYVWQTPSSHGGTPLSEDRPLEGAGIEVDGRRITGIRIHPQAGCTPGPASTLAGGHPAPDLSTSTCTGATARLTSWTNREGVPTARRLHASTRTTSLLPTTTVASHGTSHFPRPVSAAQGGCCTGRRIWRTSHGPYFAYEAPARSRAQAPPFPPRPAASLPFGRQHRHSDGRPGNCRLRSSSSPASPGCPLQCRPLACAARSAHAGCGWASNAASTIFFGVDVLDLLGDGRCRDGPNAGG